MNGERRDKNKKKGKYDNRLSKLSYNNMMKSRTVLYKIISIILSVVLVYSFYIIKPIDLDSYATVWAYYKSYNLGYGSHTFTVRPFELLGMVMYQIFGVDNKVILGIFCFFLFICIYLSLQLAGKYKGKYFFVSLAVLAYIFYPGSKSNQHHLMSTTGTLLIVYLLNTWLEKRKSRYLILAFLTTIYCVWGMADVAILGIFLFLPLMFYAVIYLWQDSSKRKYVVIFGGLFCVVYGGYRVLYLVMSQKCNILLPMYFSGYGGGDYAYWGNFTTAITCGVGGFFDSLCFLWNIPIEGTMIQYNSINWCIRLFLLFWTIVLNVRLLVDIFRKGIKNIPFIDAFCSLCFLTVALINILNGANANYASGGLNRYAAILEFTMAITLARRIIILLIDDKIGLNLGEHKLTIMVCVVSGCLIISYMDELWLGKSHFSNQMPIKVSNTIEELNLSYGLGTWESAVAAFSESHGECKVTVTRFGNEEALIRDDWAGDSADGSNYFNYLLISQENYLDYAVEDAKEDYGQPVNEVQIVNNNDVLDSTVLIYDYDVRWKPEYFYCYDNYFESREIPIGKSRLIIHGDSISDANLIIEQENVYSTIISSSSDCVIFEINNIGDSITCDIKIATGGNVSFGIQERLYAAIDIDQNVEIHGMDSEEIVVSSPCTEYRIVLKGKNMDKLSATVDNDNVSIELLNQGTERLVYKIQNTNKEKYNLEVINKGKEDVFVQKCAINEVEVIAK